MTSVSDTEWEAARAAWPGVVLVRAEFDDFVRERTAGDGVPSALRNASADGTRSGVRTTELYLTCACAGGDSSAIAAFERTYFAEIDLAVRRLRSNNAPAVDEIRQLVRHKLFVSEPGEKPTIARYSGRGDLRGWFRVTVGRLVLNLQTRRSPETPFEDRLLAHLLGVDDPSQIDFPKESYKNEFRAAFPQAFARLSAREQSLLRYSFGEDLTVEMIGKIYGVHKTTAARWVVRAQEALLTTLQSIIVTRLGITDEEYASVLQRVRDSLELSLERVLRE
jgi:RNA polymerase sigma-70 factor, ECF subfamily